jgi:hypothetical protein
MVGEPLGRTLFTVDNDKHFIHDGSGISECVDGVESTLSGRRHVFDNTDPLAVSEFPLNPIAGGVWSVSE